MDWLFHIYLEFDPLSSFWVTPPPHPQPVLHPASDVSPPQGQSQPAPMPTDTLYLDGLCILFPRILSSSPPPHNMLLPAPGHLGDLWLFCPPSVPLVSFTVSMKSIQTHTKSNVLPYDTEELWPVNIRWAEGGRAVVWRLYWKTGLALETSAGITMKTHFCQAMVVYAFNLRT